MSMIVNAIYQRDELSVVSEAYHVFNDLLVMRIGQSKSMKGCKLCFEAEDAKCNAISSTKKVPEFLTALILISNSKVSDSQRLSVIAAVASASDIQDIAMVADELFLQ